MLLFLFGCSFLLSRERRKEPKEESCTGRAEGVRSAQPVPVYRGHRLRQAFDVGGCSLASFFSSFKRKKKRTKRRKLYGKGKGRSVLHNLCPYTVGTGYGRRSMWGGCSLASFFSSFKRKKQGTKRRKQRGETQTQTPPKGAGAVCGAGDCGFFLSRHVLCAKII